MVDSIIQSVNRLNRSKDVLKKQPVKKKIKQSRQNAPSDQKKSSRLIDTYV